MGEMTFRSTTRMSSSERRSTTPRKRNSMMQRSSSIPSNLPTLSRSSFHTNKPPDVHVLSKTPKKDTLMVCRKRNVLPGIAMCMILSRIVYQFYWVHTSVTVEYSTATEPNARLLDAPLSPPRKAPSNPRMDPWNMVDKSNILEARRLAHLERQERTMRGSDDSIDDIASTLRDHFALDSEDLSISDDMESIDWPHLCKTAKFDRHSRVVITGLFSVDPGPSLAYLLADRCHVSQIAGVDPIMPNLRHVRMAAMKLYKELYRSIDHFHLIIPTAAAGLSKRGERYELEWLHHFQPTHILHLEATTPSPHFAPFIQSEAHLRLYHQQHAALALDQLRTYVAQSTKHVQLLHVSVGKDHDESSSQLPMTRLELPNSYGPYTISQEYHHGSLFVDSAVAAIVQCMGNISNNVTKPRRYVVTAPDKKTHSVSDFIKAVANPYDTDLAKNLTQYRREYGVYANRLPCASSCAITDCATSVLDDIIPITQKATEQCLYVVYTVDFDANLRHVYKPPQKDQPLLCRIAFVSEQSPVAQHAMRNGDNGQVVLDNWTIVWSEKDDRSLSTAELSLLPLEPTRFFHPKVRKAMYAGSRVYAEPPDASILNILVRLDHHAMPRHYVKEYRHGTKLSRFVERGAEQARTVGFFASEPSVAIPSVNAYQKLADSTKSTVLNARQVAYYKHTAHWIQMDMNRPDLEMRNTVFAPFPFQWVSMGLLVHDLQTIRMKQFRCHWLDESTYWGSVGADELSLAYVIAERRMEGKFGVNVDEDWIPLLQPTDQQRVVEKNSEVFLRILKPQA